MGVITPQELTFNGREAQSLSEAIYSASFENPAVGQFHTIISGVKAKQQIAILGALGLTGRGQTRCDITANPGTIPMSEKFWDPAYIGDRFEQCWADLIGTFFMWGLKNGVKKPDLTDTDFANFLEDRIAESSIEAVFRLAYFGDTAAATISGGGVYKNGTDVGYFDPINGYWKQIAAIVAANASRRTAIPHNTGVSYAAQEFTAQDTTDKVATGIFQSLKYGADFKLRNADNKIIIATQSLTDQYEKELMSQNIEPSYTRVESGIDVLRYGGIDIIPFNFLDRTIRAYQDNGTKYNLPHRAILTTKDNLQIATEEEGNFSELDAFYDKKSKLYVADFGFNLDAKVIEDHMIQVAY